jgi:signal transduction histidine kinase
MSQASVSKLARVAGSDGEEAVRRQASRAAGRLVGFLGHLMVFVLANLVVLVTAGGYPALIVALAWGIGLACHGFFAVAAPALHQRRTDEEVARRLQGTGVDERRRLEGRHARSLEELSASIAHEIRNPITAAKSLVQQIDLGAVLDAALRALEERLTRTRARIERDVDVTAGLRGDPEQLRRVIMNLVGNALDALDDSGAADPAVRVSIGRSLAGTEVWIRVRDNGPGIEAAMLARLWSPFATSKKGGTGLGLAITRKLVEAHGGTIEVTSVPSKGTEFVVTLPTGRGDRK